MELKNKLFAMLAIFCLIASACAVCAADDATVMYNESVDAQQTHDLMILPPDFAHSEANMTGQAAGENTTSDLDAEAIHNSMVLPPDYAHSEANMTNATNATGHAAGENATQNATHTNAAQANALPATGNPILALLCVGAVLGGANLLRRNK